jgi:AP-5 complex subunit zeta-1
MNEPAICLSVLGPSTARENGPGIVDWSEGGTKMVAHVPFYLLAEQKGKILQTLQQLNAGLPSFYLFF